PSATDCPAITIAATTGELEATAGTLTIDGGSISNNRELLATGSGTTLILESLTVTNSATANVEVDAGATLDLESATISGGIVTVDGLLDSTGTSAIDGAAITIAATTGELEATAGTLTIDGGSISNNRELLATGSGTTLILESLTVTNSATANVEVDAGATLDLESATISGGIVTVDGLLDSTGTSAIDGAAITIAATTGELEATAGTLTIDGGSISNNRELLATGSGTTLILESLTVTNSATANVEVDAGATLDLESATISGGIVTVDGLLDSTGTSAIDGAAITIAATTGELEATAGTLTIDGGSISNNRELLATGSGTTLILESLTVTNSATANVEVDAGATLDLESATISGGIVTVDGLLDSTGTSAIDGAAITIAATTGELEATAGTLTIDGGSISNNRELLATGSGTTLILESLTVTNSATANVEVDAGATLDLESATISGGIVTVDGLLDSTGTSAIDGAAITIAATTGELEATAGTLTIDGGSISNNRELLATGSGTTLILESLTVTNSATANVEVDAGATLDLESATISGGIVTVDGLLDSTGTSAIDGAAITIAATTGELEATAGTLTIDGGLISNNRELLATGSGTTLILESLTVTNSATANVEVDAGATLDLESATISGGIVTVDGLLDSTGTSAIDGAAITIAATTGELEATAGTLTIDGGSISNNRELLATGSGTTLILESLTVTNSATANVEVDAGATLDLESATISGGIVTVDGLLDSTGNSAIDGAAITIASTGTLEATSGTLTINPSTINNAGTLEADGATLVLVSLAVTNTGTVEATGTDGIIDLLNATISGGTVKTVGSGDVIEATVGTSTIESTTSFSNAGTLEADGGALDIDNVTSFINSGTLLATADSLLVLNGDTVTNTGTVEVDADSSGHSTLDFNGSSLSGGTLTVDGLLDSTGNSAIDGAAITIASTGTLEATG